MSSGIGSLYKVLKDENRRRIILLLQEKGSLSYVDLMKALGVVNTGKMNYHLKVLGNLLSKNENGQYILSEKGVLASRLLQEFSEADTAIQLKSSSKRSQVLWGGIIICVFALIGWFSLFRFLNIEFGGSYASDVEPSGPLFFLVIIFSFIGAYIIISDLRKNSKTHRILSNLAKGAVILFTISLIILGSSLVGFSMKLPNSVEHLTEVAHQDNPGANYTIFLSGPVFSTPIYRLDLVIANTTGINPKTLNVTVTNIEHNQTSTVFGGDTIKGQTFQVYLPLEVGHNRIDWDGLDVTQMTLYMRMGESPNVARINMWIAGLLTLVAGTIALFGFEVNELFQGRKTGIFWWGLIIFGLALSWLFGVLWFGIVVFSNVPFLSSIYGIGQILPSLAFLYVGFRMMQGGVMKESQTYAALKSRLSGLQFYLSQRNYRGLVYLLASVLIVVLASGSGSVIGGVIQYIDILGVILLFLFFGPPSMYGGWINPAYSVLAYAVLVFGLFVEIFILCEFFILVNAVSRTQEPEPKTCN